MLRAGVTLELTLRSMELTLAGWKRSPHEDRDELLNLLSSKEPRGE